MRYLAIDYGKKRTGLAICDADEKIVSPLKIIQGQKNILTEIIEITMAEGVEAIVLGLPFNMDGTEGFQAKLVREFAKKLKESLPLAVYFQDERLSSFGAEEKLASAGFTKAAQKDRLDAVAAAEILEAFLEQKRNTGEAGTDPAP